MSEKILLIDGHSILNRAFYALPILTNSEGIPTNGVLGFLNIMFKILDEEKPEYLVVAFDVHHPTFRHTMYSEYKGTRKSMPEELLAQVPVIKDVLTAMGVKIIEAPGFEADDILGTIAKRAEQEGIYASVLSGDRDLLQLATDMIKIRIPKTKKGGTEIEDYNAADVMEKYNVTPLEFIDLKGLMGDASDNIPGVPGVGEKTASKIITMFSSIENAYEHIEEVTPNKAKEALREHYDLAVLSKTLATIKIDCELDFKIKDAAIQNLFNEDAYSYYKKLELKSLLNRFNFNMDVVSNQKVEDLFKKVSTLEAADKVFLSIEEAFKADDMDDTAIGVRYMIEDGKVYGLSLCWDEKNIYYIENIPLITEEYLSSQVKKLLDKGIKIATFDLKSQLSCYHSYIDEIKEELFFDEMIAGYLLNPLKDSYNYDDIGRDYLDLTIPSREDFLGKKSLAASLEEESFLTYACYQGYIGWKAYKKLKEAIQETNMEELFYQIEMPLVFTLYDMEVRGIGVNRAELKEYGDKLAVTTLELESKIHELVGEGFNINSPKQLGVILFDKLRLPFGKKTKTGYSTSADILEKLIPEHPVISLILEYRQITKLKSTYADGLAAYIGEDERIHGKFHQTIAATGRLSSTEPNLQNIPIRMELGRVIRKVFIPKKDYIFVDADYSQIELRVLAHMSGDERLIAAYKEAQDIHKITASEVFHTPLDEVTPEQRSNAKAVNFGIVYGISSFGLGQDLKISKKEAENYISKYFETYPKVKEFLDGLVEQGKKEGYVTTLFGRKRPIPELTSSNFMQRSFGERVAMNSPIQGTAADIIKIAMNRVNKKLKEKKMKSVLILQIHDELLIETAKDELEEVKAMLQKEMKEAASLHVPLEVDVNTGSNWYEAK